MMNVFEKIRERLEDAKSWEDIDGKPRFTFRDEHMLEIAIQIVNKVEQEHNNGWIACGEKLPEETGYYMACIYNSEVDDFDFRKTWFAHVDDYDMEESEWRELYDFETVTAWQNLPQPYKERDTNGN